MRTGNGTIGRSCDLYRIFEEGYELLLHSPCPQDFKRKKVTSWAEIFVELTESKLDFNGTNRSLNGFSLMIWHIC